MKEWVSMASPMGALPLWSISLVKLGRTQHSLMCDVSGGDVKKYPFASPSMMTKEMSAP